MRFLRSQLLLFALLISATCVFAQKKATDSTEVVPPGFPKPGRVALQSTMVPGWGQVTNKEWWKVPIIYGGLIGLVYLNRTQAQKYQDYRAAYYNLQNPEGDSRFGSTPSYLVGKSQFELRSVRNASRNQRDISYVYIGLFYGLNILDAYIFAHLRPFDVNDDLSLAPSLNPLDGNLAPAIKLSIKF